LEGEWVFRVDLDGFSVCLLGICGILETLGRGASKYVCIVALLVML
jgi:hypothetical protein